jgi:hypothetical protein
LLFSLIIDTKTDNDSSDNTHTSQHASFFRALSLLIVSLFPLALTSFIWLEVWNGVASRAIDGSAHFAVAQIYDQTIFPETFGWTNAYFAGMSFPNFYPPLYFWLVALIHHTHLVSFATAFKLVMAVPLLLIPAAFWFFVWFHGGKNSATAFSVAIVSMILLTLGEVFQPNTGLDMSSTILDGFYTQPLGFLLLLLWLLVYLLPKQRWWQFTLSAVLLTLTVLANFFNAITAIVFITAVLLFDVFKWIRAADRSDRNERTRTFLSHFISPAVTLLLTAFWIVPMVTSYKYLVTRPIVVSLLSLAKPALWVWYLLGAIGFILWFRRPKGSIGPYLITCITLFVLLVFSSSVAPPWFPLQVFRFFSTVNLLLAIPVGLTVAVVAQWYVGLRPAPKEPVSANKISPFTKSILLFTLVMFGLIGLGWVMSTKRLVRAFAFYTPENFERIAGVLDFGKTHTAGRYLVEVLPSTTGAPLVRADSLALNAYLGSQGNQTITIVYREASPNSPFFNAELNAFSSYTENFGVSSALMDDLDFLDQPLTQHLKRLTFIGVKYLVIASPEMKDRLNKQTEISAHYDIGGWTVFELGAEAAPPVRPMQYRPALVVSDFTEKLRRQDQLDFVRLAEEQFKDGWFDVLLVHSPESRLDRLSNLNEFGSLIVDKYDFDNEESAFEQLKVFAQSRPIILLRSDQSLFQRIKAAIADFPNALILERPDGDASPWIDALQPRHHYDSNANRQLWKSVRQVLESRKIGVPTTPVTTKFYQNAITVEMDKTALRLPLVISTSFHPKWIRSDHEALYATTPFFTIGFFDKSVDLTFQRSWYDRVALWCSGVTLLALCAFAGVSGGRGIIPLTANSSLTADSSPGCN